MQEVGLLRLSCLNTNRKYIVNDIELKYVEIIENRIKERLN